MNSTEISEDKFRLYLMLKGYHLIIENSNVYPGMIFMGIVPLSDLENELFNGTKNRNVYVSYHGNTLNEALNVVNVKFNTKQRIENEV
jgi:hypothetical protein